MTRNVRIFLTRPRIAHLPPGTVSVGDADVGCRALS
ncbi:hypothetical protein RCH22_001477 [Cryobacterium psychrotolerans]|nr:hypothetical protein [Cryobacterium psychrotolerans]